MPAQALELVLPELVLPEQVLPEQVLPEYSNPPEPACRAECSGGRELRRMCRAAMTSCISSRKPTSKWTDTGMLSPDSTRLTKCDSQQTGVGFVLQSTALRPSGNWC